MLTEGMFLICIGLNACSMALTQHCSVVLGENLQPPDGDTGSQVLVTPFGIEPLYQLDDRVLALITAANPAAMPFITDHYIDQWNAYCAPRPIS